MEIAAVIPCYNGEKFVQAALDSVAAQTLPVSEIIFVDDGSADHSVDVARAWQQSHNHLKMQIIKQENKGVSVARNTGWQAATAPWIAFLDIDDIWHPGHNSILAGLVSSHNDIVLAFGDADRINIEGGEQQVLASSHILTGLSDEYAEKQPYQAGSSLYRKLLTKSFIPTCSTLVKRETLENIGGFELGRAYGEDRQMWLRLFTRGMIIFSNQRVSQVLYHDSNATHASNAVRELVAKLHLAKAIEDDPRTYKLGREEIEVLKAHNVEVLGDIRYTASKQGVAAMRSAQQQAPVSIPYSARDWLRGIWSSLVRSP